PWPQDLNPLKITSTTALGPDRYPANSLGSPRPSPAITACHRHSHRHLRHPLAITAMTTTSAPVSAITLLIASTSALAPPVAPGLRRDPYHASQSCITATRPLHAMPCSRSLLTAPPLRVSALCNMSQPCPAPRGLQVSPQAPVPRPAAGTQA
ncbi:hypothetical protein C0993_007607, partial [Termitomyces sp. T159_Od127]